MTPHSIPIDHLPPGTQFAILAFDRAVDNMSLQQTREILCMLWRYHRNYEHCVKGLLTADLAERLPDPSKITLP
jgi:hypothetical protein